MSPLRWTCSLCVCVLAAGCLSEHRFVEIAPGVRVSSKSIDEYADQHGISQSEAKRRIKAELTSSGSRGPEAKAGRALEVVTGEELDGAPSR